tara:strand:+ start:428 stop:616 length:189 start_codon:yes stop_codon:yes gene_type:complete
MVLKSMDYENQTIIKLSDAPIIINQLKKSDLSLLFNLNPELNQSSNENLKKGMLSNTCSYFF